MASPLAPAFWLDEEALLWETMAEAILEVLMAGASAGIDELPTSAQALANVDAINQAAIDFLRGYRLENVHGIIETTRDQATQVVEQWLRSGEPLNLLEVRLEPIFGEGRASSIAATEVTRIYQQGNTIAWRSTGFVRTAIYHTVNDDLVCDICAPRDEQEFVLGDPEWEPPAHVRCRCWSTPLVSEEMLEQELERILEE